MLCIHNIVVIILISFCIKSLLKSKKYSNTTNYNYGRSTLTISTAGVHKKSNLKREYYSKIDTADFYALPTIKTTWDYQR